MWYLVICLVTICAVNMDSDSVNIDSDNVKELLEREFSLDIVTRLLNVIEFNSYEDLVRNYYRTCKLKEIYDSLFNILFHHIGFKENKERFCCLCRPNRTDKPKSYDVIDGIY